ncbi:hypothetical protein D1007_48977 [Hordeum vulgare]|nr:hypothetical protein D1007_48977 [Hordeum vulgare]
MAKASKVSPTLNSNISHVDDNGDEDNDKETDNIASLKIKGEMIFKSLYKNKLSCSNFLEIMSIATEGKKYIEELEAHLEEHEATIETRQGHERDYANEIAELSQALDNEQTTKESLEKTFALELSTLKGSYDRALEVANDFRTKNDKLQVAHAKLLKDYEHLENGSRAIKSSLIELTKSHAQLEASYAKELAKDHMIVCSIRYLLIACLYFDAAEAEAARNRPPRVPQLRFQAEKMSFLVSIVQGMEKNIQEIMQNQKSLERVVETKFHNMDVKVTELTTIVRQLQHEVDSVDIPRSEDEDEYEYDDDDQDESPPPTTTRFSTKPWSVVVPTQETG